MRTLRDLLIALAVLIVVLVFAIPASTWEFDETLFFRALSKYDPISHHPPPPGYPLFIGAGKLFRLLIPGDFAALVTLSVVASIAGFLCLAAVFRNFTNDWRTGVVGALLFYLSPAMLVHSTLPISDPGALALFAASLLLGARLMATPDVRRLKPAPRASWYVAPASAGEHTDAVLFGAMAGLTVGWRPQFSLVAVPLLFAVLFFIRSWRARVVAVATFTVVCIGWLLPLIASTGGLDQLLAFEGHQAGYLAEHDADASRSGWTLVSIALRFIAHPWGIKLLSIPILLFAFAGIFFLVREKRRMAIPLAFAAMVYLGFAFWVMDPADGVRYALPFVLFTAFLASVGIVEVSRKLRFSPYMVLFLCAGGFFVYAGPLLLQRRKTPSPPVQAATYAQKTFPKNAVALYELPLGPHATYLLEDYSPASIDAGLREHFDEPKRPVFLYADGASRMPGAQVFRWRASDAYSKLTRNHYRVASIIPLPPERRFAAIRGIYQTEREVDGDEWRWLADHAELRLPKNARRVRLTLGVPVRSLPENMVTVSSGSNVQKALIAAGGTVVLVAEIPNGERILRIDSARAFVPAELTKGVNRDRRRLAVMLHDFLVMQ